jgi:hypothetical protein
MMGDMRGDGSTFGYGGLDGRIGQYHAKEGLPPMDMEYFSSEEDGSSVHRVNYTWLESF